MKVNQQVNPHISRDSMEVHVGSSDEQGKVIGEREVLNVV